MTDHTTAPPRAVPTTPEQRVGQRLFVGFDGHSAPDHILDWLRAGRVGGIILFARNVASPAQLAALTTELQASAPFGVVISIDQEGGTVARLRDGFTEVPSAMALASGAEAEATTERVYAVLGTELRAMGLHWNYAPVVDVSYNAANPSVGTRAFADDPARVGALAAAAVRGLQSVGVAACAKHFPGLGNTAIDTHRALPTLDTPLDHVLAVDLAPYRAVVAAGVASVMSTHTIYRALDRAHPATLSGVVVERLLRGELGYDGVVTTDCLEMQAITDHYGPGEAAVLAAVGGADAVLVSHTRERQQAAFEALLAADASGRLPSANTDVALRRLGALKAMVLQPPLPHETVRSGAHLAVAQQAARAGVTLLGDATALPVGSAPLVVEFASHHESDVLERGEPTNFARLVKVCLPQADAQVWTPQSHSALLAAAPRASQLVLATRSAHLSAAHTEAARALLAAAPHSILVALRNPYDAAALPGAHVTLCTCGDAAPSLEAAVDALLGVFTPTGHLPVRLDA